MTCWKEAKKSSGMAEVEVSTADVEIGATADVLGASKEE